MAASWTCGQGEGSKPEGSQSIHTEDMVTEGKDGRLVLGQASLLHTLTPLPLMADKQVLTKQTDSRSATAMFT